VRPNLFDVELEHVTEIGQSFDVARALTYNVDFKTLSDVQVTFASDAGGEDLFH